MASLFYGRDIAEEGYGYRQSPKVWMNKTFFKLLPRLDSYIGQNDGRKIAFLIDNASCHGTIEALSVLQHIQVIYLPRKTGSKIQPLDAGIISCIKQYYQKQQRERALSLIDLTDNFGAYSVGLYTAIV